MRTGNARIYTVNQPISDILAVALLILAGTLSMPVHVFASSSASLGHFPTVQSVTAATIYASDCTTPKTTFNLGETVCARLTGASGFALQWVNASGFVVAVTRAQTDSFVLPSTDQSTLGGLFTVNNLGRWRVNAATTENSVDSSAFFTVRDPNNPRVDLSISNSLIGSIGPVDGAPIQFAVRIVNGGPNDAVNVHFSDNTFSNAIFNSLSQTSGPTFTCSGTDCQIANLPNAAEATFILNFTTGPPGGVLGNTATVSSSTTELNPQDNSSSATQIPVGTTGTPPTCNIAVAGPPSVTLFTGPGATSCSVTVSDLDGTLGTATATDNCPLVGSVTRSGVPAGNIFPVGVTILTYKASDAEGNTASAIQQVTVVDNTPPSITCPPNITLEPTCPSGAIATWAAPTGSDNCPGASTLQSGGPSIGSVFPIGTTSVAYTVTDAAGNQASCSFTVTVLTVVSTIQNLRASVSASSLEGQQKQGLLPKLDAALDAFNRGNTKPACNTLSSFTNAVQNLVHLGDISPAQGQAWIDSANHVGNTIGCTNDPCS